MQEPHDKGRDRPKTLRLASFAATSLGGLLVGLGSLLDWATVAPHIPGATGTALNSDIPGIDLAEGKITLVLGFTLLVVGVVMRGISSGATARILGWVIVAASIVATGIAVLNIVRKDSAFDSGAQQLAHRIADTTGLPYNDIFAKIERYLVVDLKLGIYLVIIGGIIGLIGGLFGVAWVSGRDREPAPPVTDAPVPPDRSSPLPPPEPGSPPAPEPGSPPAPGPDPSLIPPD
jgi:hypothetical protein